MNKSISDIKSYLDRKEAERNELVKNGKAKLAEAENKLSELIAKRDLTTDTDEYLRLSKEIKDTESVIGFLKNRANTMNNGSAAYISKEELASFNREIDSAINKLQEAKAPEIRAEIDKLVKLMDSYADEAEELDKLKERLYRIANPKAINTIQAKADGIISRFPTIFGFWEAFWNGYFQRRYIISIVKDDPESVLNSVSNKKGYKRYSPEEMLLAKALIEQKK